MNEEYITIDTERSIKEPPTAVKVKQYTPYKLVEEKEKILSEKAEVFDFSKRDDAIEISGRLVETIKLHRALGLAASQCGILERVFVMGAEEDYTVMFNPSVIYTSDEQTHMEEGCLSYPFMFLCISRPSSIRIKYQNELGKEKEVFLEGLSARIAQHEIDHLNGITFHKRAKPLALKTSLKKREKQIQKFARELVSKGVGIKKK